MKETSVRIPHKSNPVLLDRLLQDIQKKLKDRLKWLDFAFGRAYKLVEHNSEGNKFIYPAAYNGDGEYISLLPNDNFGNFSWFDIYDPQKITQLAPSTIQYTLSGAIVFWYSLASIYPDAKVLYTEEVKDEIIKALTAPGLISTVGRLTIAEVYERFENIYKGYSEEGIRAIDRHFFMYPYAGIRIEFTLKAQELCKR